jgi:hypothetical protein
MEILDEVDEHRGAALTLDPRDQTGELGATYGRSPSAGTPEAIWHGRVLRLWLPDDLDAEEARKFLEGAEGKALLDRIEAGHDVEWDGNNNVGSLDDDGQDALDALEAKLSGLKLSDHYEHAGTWEVEDWLSGATARTDTRFTVEGTPPTVITAKTTDDEIQRIAEQLDEEARGEFVSLRGTYNYLVSRRDDLEEEEE